MERSFIWTVSGLASSSLYFLVPDMASRAAVVTRQVKPLLSSDAGDAKLRVLSLYKAWYRHIPFMCKDFSLPRNVDQCKDALR